jgi:hypothetical protein
MLFTCSNISRTLTWGCCCICCCSHFPIFPGTLTWGCDVVVSAVVYRFQYFQGLLPGGDVVVSAVVYRFQYFQELSPLSAVVLILFGEYFLGSPVFLSKNNKTLHIEIAGKKYFFIDGIIYSCMYLFMDIYIVPLSFIYT